MKTYIEEIQIRGFKSFNKKVHLRFSPGMNCVIGANGSGKSNVLDGLCFVIGKMSSKDLRAENFGELLFKRKTTAAAEGEVSIILDNSAGVFPVDTKKVEVSRKIKKTGQTQYKINGKNATRQQVLELVMPARIFPEGHNIIMQGDIARFVDMRPLERRMVIEEVSGIAIYEDRKKKALTELGHVDEHLKEANIIITEKESYLKNLEDEKANAEKYRDAQTELKAIQAAEIKLRMDHIENKKRKVISDLQVKDQEISNLKLDIEISSKKVEELKKSIEKLEKDIEKKGGEESLVLQKDIENQRVNLEKSRTLVAASINEIRRIEERKATLEQSLKDLEIKISEKQTEKGSLEKEKQKLLKEEEALKKHEGMSDAKDLTVNAEELEKEIESLNKEKEKLHNSISDTQSKMRIAEHDLQSMSDRFKDFKALGEVKDFKASQKKLIDEINTLASRDSKLALEMGEIKKDIIKKEEELAKVRVHAYAAQEALQRDAALKLLLSKKKQIPGLLGTVAELGNVDQNYSVALSVAAGNRMKNVVVEDSDSAIKCLQMLKDSKSGIATFLPLDKLRIPRDESPEAALKKEGVVALASELVTCDKKYKGLFEYIFRDTLVIRDVSVAKSLGTSKYRMVTLEGDLFEKTGAITGGFRDKRAITSFSNSDSTERLEKLEGTILELQGRSSDLEVERSKLDDEIMRLRTQRAELEGKANLMKDSSIDFSSFEKDSKKLEEKKKDLAEELKEFDKDLEKLEKSILEKISEKNSIRSRLKELQFGETRQEVQELNEKKNLMESSLATAVATETALIPQKQDIQKVLKGLEKEKKEFEKQIKTEESNIKNLEKEVEAKEKEQESFNDKLKSLMAEKSEKGTAIRDEETKLNEYKFKIGLAEQTVNNLKIDKAEHDASIAGLEQEYVPFKEVTPFEGLKSMEDAKRRISAMNNKLISLGNVNMRALEIFDAVKKEYEELATKVQKLTQEKLDVMSIIDEIEKRKKESFMKTYDAMEKNFREIHAKVASKNHAQLELENPENPFEGGVLVRITDVKGKKMGLTSLSGGEKVLVALSFVFAIQEFEPAPFYLLDEIDAALDKLNSENVAKLIKEYSQRAQVVLVSHNDAIVSESDALFGVNMNKDGESNVVSLDLSLIEAKNE